ncbi:decaprenyl-phosphate phosphoribosyltransferase [Candidatus Poribacteria bacterium]|nr:decaprenyl-phosphate phosphoribosyltransferase [Candidatus Poribacteria bacterium]
MNSNFAMITNIFRLIRITHWVKNTFVFAPLIFSKNLAQFDDILKASLAFLSFSLMASCIYIINDIVDIEEDRQHPVKCLRPLPSGQLSIGIALSIAFIFLAFAVLTAFFLSRTFLAIIFGYLVINLLYTYYLKKLVILDVFSIATGFLLRVTGGGAAIGVYISNWLLICTALLALFLGFGKRRHELVLLGENSIIHRPVLEHYNRLFLDQIIGAITASILMSYILYTMDSKTIQNFGTDKLILTIPFVIYGIFRYQYLVYHKKEGGSPTDLLLKDFPLLLNTTLWIVSAILLIYF